jgi:flagellar hook-associated protein 3 FlgL
MGATFRVTAASNAASSISNIAAASNRLAQLEQQASSGKQINRPSDNPTGTVTAMQLNAALARNTQYGTNSNDALAWLSTADTAYSQSVNVLQKVRTDVVQALNTGAGDTTSANALAEEISGLGSTLLSLANTTYNGRPVFGGTTSGGVAFDASGTYVGDSGTVGRQVSSDTTVTVSQVGSTVFGANGSNVFNLIDNIVSTLQTDPSSLSSATLGQLDSAISQVSTAQAAEGGTYNEVQQAQSSQTTTGTALKTQLSGIVDVDFPTAAINLSSANISYQAALQTTASIRQMSLLNFLQ